MTEKELIDSISKCTKMSELSALRGECVKTNRPDFSAQSFMNVQFLFIQRKNIIIRDGGEYK